MRRIFRGDRYSVVASTLALLVALSGTAYAANTVRSRDIVNGQVKSVDIGNGEVKTIDIGNGQVRSIDIRNGTVGLGDMSATSLGRSPRLFAQVNQDGTLGSSRGVVTNSQTATGVYVLQFGRPILNCVPSVTSRVYFASAPKFHIVDLAADTATVYVYDAGGAPVNDAFFLAVIC